LGGGGEKVWDVLSRRHFEELGDVFQKGRKGLGIVVAVRGKLEWAKGKKVFAILGGRTYVRSKEVK